MRERALSGAIVRPHVRPSKAERADHGLDNRSFGLERRKRHEHEAQGVGRNWELDTHARQCFSDQQFSLLSPPTHY